MTILKEKDFGTPRPKTARTVRLQIDGFDVEVEEGASIMRAAATIGHVNSQTLRDGPPQRLRLLQALPRRDRGAQGNARFLHDAGRGRDEGQDGNAAARQASARA